MKLRPVKLSLWRTFLEEQGLSFKRVKGDHEIWNRSGLFRSVVFPVKRKELDGFFIESNLKSLGISVSDFQRWLDNQ